MKFFILLSAFIFLSEQKDIGRSPSNFKTEYEVNKENGYKGSEMIIVKGNAAATDPNIQNGVSVDRTLWPKNENGEVIVPYFITGAFSKEEKAKIETYVETLNQEFTCGTLTRLKKEISGNYIRVIKDTGCYSLLGMVGSSSQPLSLGNGCLFKGIVQHEFLHALGFSHEQARSDRDENVIINFGNIISGLENNFDKYETPIPGSENTDYDYASVMHYGKTDFGIFVDGVEQTTIITKDASKQDVIGQRVGMSESDIADLNAVYGCPPPPPPTPPPPFTIFDCPGPKENCQNSIVTRTLYNGNGYTATNAQVASGGKKATIEVKQTRFEEDGPCTSGAPYCFTVSYKRTTGTNGQIESDKAPTLLVTGGDTTWYESPADKTDETVSVTVSNVDCSADFVITLAGQRIETAETFKKYTITVTNANLKTGACPPPAP